ncbi:MAG: response regulator [Nitrospirae bacterium]|nr:response regulator [Nitrospirota bacterium]
MPADKPKEVEAADAKLALVCDDNVERQETLEDVLGDLGYSVQIAASPEDVYDKLKYNQYSVLYLHDNFGGGNSENNEILEYIQSMPISARRRTFVALAGKNYTALNHMAAFAESVNIVINEADMQEIKTILKKSITGNNLFYKVYNDILHDFGKA